MLFQGIYFYTVNLDSCGLGGHTGSTEGKGGITLEDLPDKPEKDFLLDVWCW